VRVTYNIVEDNLNGFEISNSKNITLAHNLARGIAWAYKAHRSTARWTPPSSRGSLPTAKPARTV
jgi:parallel beta-helix repeat protein